MAASPGRSARGPGRLHHQLPVLYRVGPHLRRALSLVGQDVRPVRVWIGLVQDFSYTATNLG